MTPSLQVTSQMAGERLDVVLAKKYPDYSRSFLQKWITSGHVTFEGKPVENRTKVRAGEVYAIDDFTGSSSPSEATVRESLGSAERRGKAAKISRRAVSGPVVLFEDREILVLNKPAGLVAHPAPSYRGETLVDWIKTYCGPALSNVFPDTNRLGLVHRLDKDTTGVIVVAKTPVAQTALARQFQGRSVQKTYAALVEGVPSSKEGHISAPIGRSVKNPTRMAVTGGGRPSETTFFVLQSFKEVSLMSLLPKTGRTHQIRVHCAVMGHPIVGDFTYGASEAIAKKLRVSRPLLHAESLTLNHPRTEKSLTFKAPRPADFKSALSLCKKLMAVSGLALALSAQVGAANEGHSTPAAAKKKVTAKASAPVESSAVKQLKAQSNELQLQINGLTEQLGQLAGALEQLNLATRLKDVEKSISDLNTRAASISNTAEESKSQYLESNRRLKSVQDSLDTLRDQFDRLTRDMISLRAQREGAASVAGDAGSVGKPQ